MPELPEAAVMREILESRVLGRVIFEARAYRPGILKTVDPALDALSGDSFCAVDRRGKQLVLTSSRGLVVVLHLMLAGRLVLTGSASKVTKATGWVARFEDGEDLRLVENGTAKMAKVHLVRSPSDVEWVERLGVEPLSDRFSAEVLRGLVLDERRQIKKLITDQTRIAGIGTAYADEVLFAARLSPIRYGNTLAADEVDRLYAAIREVLGSAIERIRKQANGKLLGERGSEGLAVYKRTGEPCVACGTPIAEIRFAETRTYYCPQCQARGKTIADRRAWLRR